MRLMSWRYGCMEIIAVTAWVCPVGRKKAGLLCLHTWPLGSPCFFCCLQHHQCHVMSVNENKTKKPIDIPSPCHDISYNITRRKWMKSCWHVDILVGYHAFPSHPLHPAPHVCSWCFLMYLKRQMLKQTKYCNMADNIIIVSTLICKKIKILLLVE